MLIKRYIIPILILVLAASLFAGCAASPSQEVLSGPVAEIQATEEQAAEDLTKIENVENDDFDDLDVAPMPDKPFVRVGLIKGPSGLGMLGLMEKGSQDLCLNDYDFTIAGSPQDIQTKFLSGELDITAIPINLAAALYNKTDKNLKTIAVSTLGVLYMLSGDGSVTDFASLEGKTVYATAQGSTPEYVLAYLLDKNGLSDKVNVEFMGEHTELAALVAAGEVKVAMLPQPFVTTVTSKNPDVKVIIDLNDEWRKASGGTELAMTCIVVRKEFLEDNKDAVDAFLDEYRQSTEFVNANIDKAASLSEKFDMIPEAVAKQAIPKCSIVFIAGEDMKPSADSVFKVLFDANPQSVGGALPDDAFYYTK